MTRNVFFQFLLEVYVKMYLLKFHRPRFIKIFTWDTSKKKKKFHCVLIVPGKITKFLLCNISLPAYLCMCNDAL